VSGHDVIIIGAGVQGATMALCAAERGMKALVLDDGRGEAASLNSFGIVHGGLRYLQTLDIGRWARSRAEQAWWAAQFPDYVRPLTCVMPLYRGRMRSPALFHAAFAAEAALSMAPPRGRVAGPDAFRIEGLPADDLSGFAVWPEAELVDAAGAIRALLARSGAEVRTGMTVTGPRLDAVRAVDADGAQHFFEAPTVVICAGGGSQRLAAAFDGEIPALSASTLAFNLLLDAPAPSPHAVAVSPERGKGRSYFLRPVAGGLLAGTFYAPAEDGGVPERLVQEFLDDLALAMPGLGQAAVKQVLWGHLPDAGKPGTLRNNDVLIDHGAHGGPRGVYTLLGTKLTTARHLSERLARRVWPQSRRAPEPAERFAAVCA